MTLTDRLSHALEGRLSRRSFVVRSAFAGSALAAGGAGYVLTPGTAYGQICSCANYNCDCSSTCCVGFTEFCCVLDGGYNSCPSDTIMGGWWMAQGSAYCDGPRYYMDCNATCSCTSGCGSYYDNGTFCDAACDGLDCGCAYGSCDNYLTGCFQFRYGQCNQDVTCTGRIKCRVVTCVPPWQIDPTCTTALAEDDSTANQNAACLSPGPTYPPPPCDSPQTRCEVVAMTELGNGAGYGLVTSFGALFHFGSEPAASSLEGILDSPATAMAADPTGGYWVTDRNGGVFSEAGARFYGSTGGKALAQPVVAMAARPSGDGYWLATASGQVVPFGAAANHGDTSHMQLDKPVVAMAPTPSGNGYWLGAADGGVFTFGDGRFYGSAAGLGLVAPVVAMSATPTGKGYWLFAADGGVFSFGDAKFYGSGASLHLARPVVAGAATSSGDGYYLAAADGGVFTYGNARFYGSAA